MCLITTQQKPFKATKDLTVYKVLTHLLKPLYFDDITYELGKLNKTKIKESNEWCGYNSADLKWIYKYLNMQSAYDGDFAEKCIDSKTLKCFGEGFHSSLTTDVLKEDVNHYHIMFKCTIPKGSLYYENQLGLVISNQLIINKPIKKYGTRKKEI